MPWVENQYGRGMDDNRDNVPLAINGFASGEGLKSTMKTMRINNIDNEDKASDAEVPPFCWTGLVNIVNSMHVG